MLMALTLPLSPAFAEAASRRQAIEGGGGGEGVIRSIRTHSLM
jgi:hypothetical protein